MLNAHPRKKICECPNTHMGPICEYEIIQCKNANCSSLKSCIPQANEEQKGVVDWSLCICIPVSKTGPEVCAVSMHHESRAGNSSNLDNPCTASPCHNGGTCTIIQGVLFRCVCPYKFQGLLCEKELMASEASGTCQKTNHGPLCVNGDVWGYPHLKGEFSIIAASTQQRSRRYALPIPRNHLYNLTKDDPCEARSCGYGDCVEIEVEGPRKRICECFSDRMGGTCYREIFDCEQSECSALKSCIPLEYKKKGLAGDWGICICKQIQMSDRDLCTVPIRQDSGDNNSSSAINPCTENPCRNGGTCTVLRGMVFRCICPYKFQGIYCEKDLMPTELYKNCRKTQNGPLCVNGDVFGIPPVKKATKATNNGTATTTNPLDDLFAGQEITCSARPCKNGGTCIQQPSLGETKASTGFLCVCPLHHSGSNCQHVREACVFRNCTKVETCMYMSGGTFCLCNTPLIPIICRWTMDLSTGEKMKEFDENSRFGVILFSTILVLVALILCYLLRKWGDVPFKTRKLRDRYQKDLDSYRFPGYPPADSMDVFKSSILCCSTPANITADSGGNFNSSSRSRDYSNSGLPSKYSSKHTISVSRPRLSKSTRRSTVDKWPNHKSNKSRLYRPHDDREIILPSLRPSTKLVISGYNLDSMEHDMPLQALRKSSQSRKTLSSARVYPQSRSSSDIGLVDNTRYLHTLFSSKQPGSIQVTDDEEVMIDFIKDEELARNAPSHDSNINAVTASDTIVSEVPGQSK